MGGLLTVLVFVTFLVCPCFKIGLNVLRALCIGIVKDIHINMQ